MELALVGDAESGCDAGELVPALQGHSLPATSTAVASCKTPAWTDHVSN